MLCSELGLSDGRSATHIHTRAHTHTFWHATARTHARTAVISCAEWAGRITQHKFARTPAQTVACISVYDDEIRMRGRRRRSSANELANAGA